MLEHSMANVLIVAKLADHCPGNNDDHDPALASLARGPLVVRT